MATGIEMMLKQLGIDPDAIKTALTSARNEIMSQVAQMNAKLDTIDDKLNKVLYPVAENEQEAHEGGVLDSPDKVN